MTPETLDNQLLQTSAERQAAFEVRRQARLDAMTPEQRQAAQQRIDRIETIAADKRPAFMQALQLVRIAGSIKTQVETGLKFHEVTAMLNKPEIETLDWLTDNITTKERD